MFCIRGNMVICIAQNISDYNQQQLQKNNINSLPSSSKITQRSIDMFENVFVHCRQGKSFQNAYPRSPSIHNIKKLNVVLSSNPCDHNVPQYTLVHRPVSRAFLYILSKLCCLQETQPVISSNSIPRTSDDTILSE